MAAVIVFTGTAQQAAVVQAAFRDYVDDYRVKLHWVGPDMLTTNITLLSNTALRVGADMGYDLLCYGEWAGMNSMPSDILKEFAEQEILANISNIAFANDHWCIIWSWAWTSLGYFEETFAPARAILATALLYAEQYNLQIREFSQVNLWGATLLAL